MSYGDKLMAIGDAWQQHLGDDRRRPVAIGDGRVIDPTHIDLCAGLDFLATPTQLAAGVEVTWLHAYRRNHPHIDYEAMERAQRRRRPWLRLFPSRYKGGQCPFWVFDTTYRAKPAPIRLNAAELGIVAEWSARPFVAIEPRLQPDAPPAKQWPVERYAELALRVGRQHRVMQIGAPGSEPLPGLEQLRPRSFREALAYLKAARLYIGPEGGLHHASAAMGTRAVVIFGGFVPPQVTGYPFHVNLTGGETRFCGTKAPRRCLHCARAMARITVDEVEAHARRLLADFPT